MQRRLLSIARGAVACCLAAAIATAASAHVVYQRKTLREWAQQADAVIVAEIRSPLQVWSAADGSDHQEYFSLRVVEVIAGDVAVGALDVFPHAEGEPGYAYGDRALLFLDRTAARAEFAGLADRFLFFTTQGAGQEWELDASSGAEVIAAARAWRAAGAGAGYEQRRDLLLKSLESAHRRLRTDAIADLSQMRTAVAADPALVASLGAMIAAPRLTIPERIALVRVLDGAPDFSAAAAMLRLAAEPGTEPAQHIALIRAAGALHDAAITAWLREQLAAGVADTSVAALIALGHPWHAAAVGDVAAAATAADPRVATAAVRALGGIGSAEASAALRDIAARQAPPTSSLARAQLRRLETSGDRPTTVHPE